MKRTILLITVAAFLWALPAKAELVTIKIEAVVDSVDDPFGYLEGNITPGDIITGSYTYDLSTPDSNPLGQGADYEHLLPPCGISLSVGDFVFQTDMTNVNLLVEVVNNNAGIDGYLLISYNNLSLPNGTPVNSISWTLIDYTKSALSSDALLATAPVLDDWGFNRLSFGGGTRARGYVIEGDVTSAVVIPEPATVLLVSFGGLIFVRRGKQ